MNCDPNTTRSRLIGALSVAAALVPASAHAAGVSAGTSIENTATATYSNGAVNETVTSNTVSIRVDEVLDVTVGSLDAGNVTLGSAGAFLTFQLTNTGNGPEAFELAVNPALGGDDFDPSVTQIAYDSNGNSTYDAGVDVVIAPGGATPAIPADGTLRVFVVTQLAGAVGDGDLANVRLTATAATGSGAPGTSFAGQGEGGGDAVVGTSTAEDQDEGSLIASIGAVTLAKSATIQNAYGTAEAIPGATVTYTLVATVSGSGSVNDLTITDPIPAGTTYEDGTLTLQGSALTDGAGDDAGEASAAGIAVDLGNLPGGATRTITFSVTLD